MNVQELQDIATTIRKQVGIWPFAEVGARGFIAGNFTLIGEEQRPGLRFTAKPKSRLVDVYILLDPSDTYRIVVRKRNVSTPETLYAESGLYADQLAWIVRNLAGNV